MQVELTKDEVNVLVAACEIEETLLTQYFARRAPGIKTTQFRAAIVGLQSKLSAAIEEDEKREKAETKLKLEKAQHDVPAKE